MPEPSLKLVFKGDISPGCDPRDVRAKICTLLKVDAARVESMFDGKTTVLKNNLSSFDAEKYKRKFDSTGAVSIIEPVADGTVAATVAPPVPPSPSQPRPVTPHDDPPAAHSKRVAVPAVPAVAPASRTGVVPGSRGYGILAVVFLLIGVGLLGFGVFKMVQTANFVSTSQTATGTVTGFATSRSSGSSRSTTYAPEVRFRAPSGRQIRFRSQMSTNIVSYQTGDDVAVRFDPADPRHAEIDAFMPLWGLAIILLLIGAAFSAFGRRMLGINGRAKTVVFRGPGWTGAQGEQITCPNCNFRQPVSHVCVACGGDIDRMQEHMVRAQRFSAWMSRKTNGIRIVVIVVSITFGFVSFALQWRSMASSGHSNRSVPTNWVDNDHRYEFSIPVDWQPQSTKDVVTSFPMLQRDPPAMYQLVVSSKTSPDTMMALGISGITVESVGTIGWDGIAAEIGRANKVEFSDVTEFNGLTVHRFGYGVTGGYREDAYFEAGKHVILVCFTVAAGNNLSEQIARTRNLIMNSLTGT